MKEGRIYQVHLSRVFQSYTHFEETEVKQLSFFLKEEICSHLQHIRICLVRMKCRIFDLNSVRRARSDFSTPLKVVQPVSLNRQNKCVQHYLPWWFAIFQEKILRKRNEIQSSDCSHDFPSFAEKAPLLSCGEMALADLEAGRIWTQVIWNDLTTAPIFNVETLVMLNRLRELFSIQLPMMPVEYITRVVFDSFHRCLVLCRKGRLLSMESF